jgi:hypothetical protein
MSSTSGGANAAPEPSNRLPTSVGFIVGVGSFLVEFLVAFAIGNAELTVLVPLAFLVFGVYAVVGMGFAPSRPFQRGFTPGLAVGVLVWLTLFDQNTLDVVLYLVITIVGWAAGLELSRRRGRLPAELPPTGRRRQGPARRR